MVRLPSKATLKKILTGKSNHLPDAIRGYPSRGQSFKQEQYTTPTGEKIFRKEVSDNNHKDCQINTQSGTLAEREFWSFQIKTHLEIETPDLMLWDKMTTVQVWLDLPDAKTFSSTFAKLRFTPSNIFECALFDWISGQQDRHNANYLYDHTRQKVILIDSAMSLLKYDPSIPHYLEFFEIAHPEELSRSQISSIHKKKLNEWNETNLKKIVPLRDKEEFQALQIRIEKSKKAASIQDLLNLFRKGSL